MALRGRRRDINILITYVIPDDSGHKSGSDCSNNLDRIMA
jgi:hypothetical protein